MNRDTQTTPTFPIPSCLRLKQRDCEEITTFQNSAVVTCRLGVSWLRIQEMRNQTNQETGIVGKAGGLGNNDP